jgi:hypothetical protein
MVLDMSPIRRNHGDPAVDEGGDTDASVGVERQRIEALESADPGDEAAALRARARLAPCRQAKLRFVERAARAKVAC